MQAALACLFTLLRHTPRPSLRPITIWGARVVVAWPLLIGCAAAPGASQDALAPSPADVPAMSSRTGSEDLSREPSSEEQRNELSTTSLGPTVNSAQLSLEAPNTASEQRTEGLREQTMCPSDMALVSKRGDTFCIDRFEASVARRTPQGQLEPWPGNRVVGEIETEMIAISRAGVSPQGFISGKQAAVACARAGKRLCQSQEWIAACRGPDDTRYPYGKERRAGACNDRFKGIRQHPVVRLFRRFATAGTSPKTMWSAAWINDPRLHELPETVTPTGSHPDCVNGYGIADMVGNLHEWVADPGGVFRGGFFMDTYQHGEGCEYKTTVHGAKYHDYSTGFRCCRDAGTEPFWSP